MEDLATLNASGNVFYVAFSKKKLPLQTADKGVCVCVCEPACTQTLKTGWTEVQVQLDCSPSE